MLKVVVHLNTVLKQESLHLVWTEKLSTKKEAAIFVTRLNVSGLVNPSLNQVDKLKVKHFIYTET